MSAWSIAAIIAAACIGWWMPGAARALASRGPVRTAAIARDRLLGLYHPAADYRGTGR